MGTCIQKCAHHTHRNMHAKVCMSHTYMGICIQKTTVSHTHGNMQTEVCNHLSHRNMHIEVCTSHTHRNTHTEVYTLHTQNMHTKVCISHTDANKPQTCLWSARQGATSQGGFY